MKLARITPLPAVVILLLAGAAEAQDYERYDDNGHYYVYVNSSQTWGNARAAAEKLLYLGWRGHLVTVTSSGENNFVHGTVLSGMSGSWWLGAVQDASGEEPDQGWLWVTGEEWSYTNWNTNEPNDVGGEDVAEIYASSGVWNDNKETATRPYIVEFEPTVFVVIDSDRPATKITDVTLTLSWGSKEDPQEMRIRNVGGEWTPWNTLSTSVAWTIPDGDGLKTVEIELRDGDGVVLANRDSIWLDRVSPSGSISIQGGADWTGDTMVALSLSYSDAVSGVAEMRFRNEGGAWEPWMPAGKSAPWTLVAGTGPRVVEAQFRDQARNESEVVSDGIGLDQTAPTVSLTVEEGNYTATRNITLVLSASDVGSGVDMMRFRPSSEGPWEDWTLFRETTQVILPFGSGSKWFEAQVRDAVGNESEPSTASVTLDQAAPECTSFRINVGEHYVLPDEKLTFEVYGSDNLGGSGVEGFKASFDGGTTWSQWYSLVGNYLADVDRPDEEGLVTARIVLRDKVGNESDERDCSCYLIESDLHALGGGGKLTGSISPAEDVDAFEADLVEGDVLTVKVKGKATRKGESLLLAIDLVDPAGNRAYEGRYPPDARAVMISGYVAESSGKHIIVLRRDRKSQADEGTHMLSVKVKQAKEHKKGKATAAGEIAFPAPRGATLKAVLKGEGLTAAAVSLVGPEGPVPFEWKEKNGKVTILPTVLDGGTGTYAIRFPEAIEAACSWKLKLPRKLKETIVN